MERIDIIPQVVTQDRITGTSQFVNAGLGRHLPRNHAQQVGKVVPVQQYQVVEQQQAVAVVAVGEALVEVLRVHAEQPGKEVPQELRQVPQKGRGDA